MQIAIKQDKEAVANKNREAFVESVGPHDKSGQYEKAEPIRQISEQAAYAAAKPDQKVLKAGQWLPAKKNECPSVETGLIVRGDNAGSKRLVCCNGACKVHKHTLNASGSSGRTTQVDYDLERYKGFKKRNMGTSMISKSQEETEVSVHLEEMALEAKTRRLSWRTASDR